MKKIKVAVIGSGSMAQEHIRVINDFELFEIKGIHSRNSKTANDLSREYRFPQNSDSIANLYQSTKADLVVVAVPELVTEQIMIEVVKYPWVSLVEKPVGFNLEVAKRIQLLVEESKHISFIGLNRRQYESSKELRRGLSKCKDAVRNIRINDQQNLIQARELGQPELVIDNWHFANSIHILDYAVLLARGSVKSITKYSNMKDTFSTGIVNAFIEYSSGDTVLYTCQFNTPSAWSVNVNCGYREWELKPLEQLRYRDLPSREFVTFEINRIELDYKPGFYAQIQEISSYFEGNSYNLPGLRDGIKTMELINEIFGEASK